MRDIWQWTDAEIIYTRCGLNAGDNVKYNIPEKMDDRGRPLGTFEWEALSHEDAGQIILSGLREAVDLDLIAERIEDAQERTRILRTAIQDKLAEL